MPEPTLEILGVYRPHIPAETWQEQFASTGDFTKEHFDSLVLIEATVEGLDEPFNMIEFGQPMFESAENPSTMQVGYDEGLLSADGETLIIRDMDCIRGSGKLRFAVYLHMYDPNRPLLWQKGEVICPPVQDVPVRLAMLMPYCPCD